MTQTGGPGSTQVPTRAETPSAEAREAKMAEGADRLARGRRLRAASPEGLLMVAATLMTTGISAIVLGWFGAARSTLVEEQIPYLISGGLLGVALATIGALLVLTRWLTVAIREARRHESARRRDHEELVETLRALVGLVTPQERRNGSPGSTPRGRPVRRGPRGT